MRVVVILFLVAIVVSLASALGFLLKDRGQGQRTVLALSIRVGFSLVLFLALLAAQYFGLIHGKL